MSNDSLQRRDYWAFISYRHADNREEGRRWATWLHEAIESYEVPPDLVGKKNNAGIAIPEKIFPVFRDEEELPADADLSSPIYSALDNSKFLVVLCSPRAMQSLYVASEIAYFKKLGHSNKILALILDGEPNASWDEGKQSQGYLPEEECFPEPLRHEVDEEGNPDFQTHAEPIAADVRILDDSRPRQGFTTSEAYRMQLEQSGEHNRKEIGVRVANYAHQLDRAKLKVIAGILGVPLGELTKRDQAHQLALERNRAKRLRRWLVAVAALTILSVGAGILAWQAREEAVASEGVAVQAREKAVTAEGIAVQEREKAVASEAVATQEREKAVATEQRALRTLSETLSQQAQDLASEGELAKSVATAAGGLRQWPGNRGRG